MKTKKSLNVLVLLLILFSIASCGAQLDGKYRQLEDFGKRKATNITKEFRKGKFKQIKETKVGDVLLFKGKYTVINDSIFAETMDYDFWEILTGKTILPWYKIDGDTLREGFDRYDKVKGSNNIYHTTPISVLWIKIKD